MARRRTRAARRIAERTAANARRRDEAIAEQEPPRPARARHKTQLEFLENRGSISTGQRRAGERLARDFQIAGGMPRVIAPYQASAGRPQRRAFVFNGEDGPRQIDARRRFESADTGGRFAAQPAVDARRGARPAARRLEPPGNAQRGMERPCCAWRSTSSPITTGGRRLTIRTRPAPTIWPTSKASGSDRRLEANP
jgi:hypothetical protein